MDESDMATRREEQDRDLAIMNVLNGNAMNPCLGAKTCVTCGEPNDRPSRVQGWDTCIDCREFPGWHLVEDGV
jgi:hypothetical protein